MNVDDVIRDFAVAGSTLPRESMRWALDNWAMAAPRFIDLLDRYADGADRSQETADALFFIVHLLGDRRETRAFPTLCKLLDDAEASEAVLSDALTETLNGVLISTYNGDLAALKGAVESDAADEFARAAALEAMAYLTRSGVVSDDDMRAYLQHLLSEMKPQGESFLWTVWAISAANLGYEDCAAAVETLIRRKLISPRDMNMRNFEEQLRRTLDDPRRMAGLERDKIEPFSDAIGTLSTWYGFSEKYREDQARAAAAAAEKPLWGEPGDTYVNPLRHVGRNDPCPCGSGKKYKKCCLQ